MSEVSSPDKASYPLPEDGIYYIRHIYTRLYLGLTVPSEGAPIQLSKVNYTTAQQWILRNQRHMGSNQDICTIQSNHDQGHTRGFFAAGKQEPNEKVLYTLIEWSITLIGKAYEVYEISYTRGDPKLVLTASVEEPEVRLANRNAGDAKQVWQFQKVV